MRSLLAVAVVLWMIHGAPVEAVVVGNPSAANGRGDLALGLESERFKDRFDRDEVRSQRYLAKLIYGLTDHVNLFAKGGTGALDVTPGTDDGSSDFEGDSRLAIGGGVRFETHRLASLAGCRLFTVLQWLQFSSEGEFLREHTYKDWTWEERIETCYRWRELGAAVGLGRDFRKVSVYAGLGLTRVTGTVDREQFVLSEDSSMKVGEGKETFDQGPGAGLFLGLDYTVSGTLQLSTEYRLVDGRHGSLFVGVSERMD